MDRVEAAKTERACSNCGNTTGTGHRRLALCEVTNTDADGGDDFESSRLAMWPCYVCDDCLVSWARPTVEENLGDSFVFMVAAPIALWAGLVVMVWVVPFMVNDGPGGFVSELVSMAYIAAGVAAILFGFFMGPIKTVSFLRNRRDQKKFPELSPRLVHNGVLSEADRIRRELVRRRFRAERLAKKAGAKSAEAASTDSTPVEDEAFYGQFALPEKQAAGRWSSRIVALGRNVEEILWAVGTLPKAHARQLKSGIAALGMTDD